LATNYLMGFVAARLAVGEVGSPLEHEDGPEKLQREFLTDLGNEVRKRGSDETHPVTPIRVASPGPSHRRADSLNREDPTRRFERSSRRSECWRDR
jgi:hypothetical protein